jgi:hypothetical protein
MLMIRVGSNKGAHSQRLVRTIEPTSAPGKEAVKKSLGTLSQPLVGTIVQPTPTSLLWRGFLLPSTSGVN